jgi:uncharacterized protein YchJ
MWYRRVWWSIVFMGRPTFPRSLAEFQARFADDTACRHYLTACRGPDGFCCPLCGDADSYALTTRDLLQCRSCRHQTSVTAGTVLDRTRLPLSVWFAAAYLVTTHTPGFAALQLQRQLGLARYETVWAMLQKLRRAMVRPERERLSGTVELDETYIGGSKKAVAAVASATARRRSSPVASRSAVRARGESDWRSCPICPLPASRISPRRRSRPAASSSPTAGTPSAPWPAATSIVQP